MNLESEHLICKSSAIDGLGLYATRPIARHGRIIEYIGERIDGSEMARRCAGGNHFIFKLNETDYLDGAVDYNFARFINHSCEPNCDVLWEGDRIWIVAARDIESGEEITFNYGYDLEDYRRYPCHCRSARCVGFIVAEEFFTHVRTQNQLSSEAVS
jgi:SET domain-containing protein